MWSHRRLLSAIHSPFLNYGYTCSSPDQTQKLHCQLISYSEIKVDATININMVTCVRVWWDLQIRIKLFDYFGGRISEEVGFSVKHVCIIDTAKVVNGRNDFTILNLISFCEKAQYDMCTAANDLMTIHLIVLKLYNGLTHVADFWPLTVISDDLRVISDVFVKLPHERSIVEEIELIMGARVALVIHKNHSLSLALVIARDFLNTNSLEWTPIRMTAHDGISILIGTESWIDDKGR